jgi:hypothetical protein
VIFTKGTQYSRKEIWNVYHPQSGDKPKGGNWDTGYVIEGEHLIAFLNIDAAGRTGHDFENAYDPDNELVTWFGKPNTHSRQPTFSKLLTGVLTPLFFARWDNKKTDFTFLGTGKILSFEDGISIPNDQSAIKLIVALTSSTETVGAEGILDVGDIVIPTYAKKVSMLVNRYERDLAKRLQCIEHFGCNCQICGFDFYKHYGELGQDFCHVHPSSTPNPVFPGF